MSQALEKSVFPRREPTLERGRDRGTKGPGPGERPRKGAYRAFPGGVRAGGCGRGWGWPRRPRGRGRNPCPCDSQRILRSRHPAYPLLMPVDMRPVVDATLLCGRKDIHHTGACILHTFCESGREANPSPATEVSRDLTVDYAIASSTFSPKASATPWP